MKKFILLCVPVLAMCGFQSTAFAQYSTSDRADNTAVKRSDQAVANTQKLVLGIAYPTSKRLDKVTFKSSSLNGGGAFSLVYRFDYTDSDGDPAHVTLRFNCDKAGKIDSISEVDRSSFWAAFGTANLLLEVLKDAIRNDAKLKDDPAARKLLDCRDAKDIVIGLMNLAR